MNETDLSLVPLDDIINEIYKRTERFVLGYTLLGKDEGEDLLYFKCSKKSWIDEVGIGYALLNTIAEHYDDLKEKEDG